MTLKFSLRALAGMLVLLAGAANAEPTLKQSTCATEVLTKLGAKCYEFNGEENWDRPSGRAVTLPVAVLSNDGSDPKLPPVFYIIGGPGYSYMENETKIRAMQEDIKPRTLVLVEQRGNMYAKPALNCPGLYKISHYGRNFGPTVFGTEDLDARIKQQSEFVKACYQKMKSEGVDVAQYTDYQIARDYDEVRKLLGYQTIDIYGGSTGGGTVVSFIKYYGGHVRSAIMGWPWLVELRNRPAIDEIFATKQKYDDVMAICVRDNKECASRFPDYLFAVDRARETLDAKPYETTVTTEKGDKRKIRIDGATFIAQLYNNLQGNYHLLPKVLGAIKRGDYSKLDEFFDLKAIDKIEQEGYWTFGSFYARSCGDMGENRPTPEESIAMIKKEPALMGFELNVFCAWWGEKGNVPTIHNLLPNSDIPVLAIHMQMDPCCTTRMSDKLVKTIPNLQQVELQGQGHGAVTACRHKIVNAFLDSPHAKIDDSCKNDEPLRDWVFE